MLSSLKVALVTQHWALIQGLRPLVSCRLWPLLDHTQRPPTLSAAAGPSLFRGEQQGRAGSFLINNCTLE